MSNQEIIEHIKDIIVFMNDKYMNINPLPKIALSSSTKYINDILGPTAYYDHESQKVTVYVANRHIIDICKSVIHELVHHHQFLEGDLTPDLEDKLTDTRYAEKYDDLRELESEAYLYSGLIFRDWRDQKREETGKVI